MSDEIIESSEKVETRTERRARLATVRGRQLDFTSIKNPDPTRHYEFVHNDEVSVIRKQNLGFDVESPDKVMKAHGDGTKPVIGDTILMSCPMEVKEDLDYLERQEYEHRHGKGGVGRNIADRDFEAGIRGEGFEDVDDGGAKLLDEEGLKSTLAQS